MTKPKPRVSRARGPFETQRVLPELNRALRAATWITTEDLGAVKLARKLAATVDQATNVRDISTAANALQRSLAGLGLTPDSRPGRTLADAVDPVVQLRAVVDSRRDSSQDRHSANR